MTAQRGRVHELVAKTVASIQAVGGTLMIPDAELREATAGLVPLSPNVRGEVARDFAVMAARFEKHDPRASRPAVAALLFLALCLVEGIEGAKRLLDPDCELSAAETLDFLGRGPTPKQAPAARAGRTRAPDKLLAAAIMRHLR